MADNSFEITKALLKFENIIEQKRLRSEPTEYFVNEFNTITDAVAFLDQQLSSPNYVEVSLVGFKDGKTMAVISDRNTPERANVKTSINANGTRYLIDQNGNKLYNSGILYIAHTQDDTPVGSDLYIETQASMPDIFMFIYYSGKMHDLDGTISNKPVFPN